MRITGTEGHDVLTGTAGDDTIDGAGGNDVIDGGGGTDALNGGAGDDRITDSGGGADTLDGGEGNDVLEVVRPRGFAGQLVTMLGGAGNDTIRFSDPSRGTRLTADAGAGDDVVHFNGSYATIALGTGMDVLVLGGRGVADLVITDFKSGSAFNGADRIEFNDFLGQNLLNWDQISNPFLTGHLRLNDTDHGIDLLISLDGSLSGRQTLIDFYGYSFAFNDYNFGGLNKNGAAAVAVTINGTEGDDTLRGGAGNDTINAGGGNDRVEGSFGADTIFGGEGDDHLNGQAGDDIVHGGVGNDILEDHAGGGGALNGDDGNDFISVSRSINMPNRALALNGGAGDDEILFRWNATDGDWATKAFAITIDAGEGADTVRLLNFRDDIAVTLGAGQDALIIGAEATLAKGIVRLADFAAGAGGDRVEFGDFLARTLVGWNQNDNPFASGHLALVATAQNGTALRIDVDGSAGPTAARDFIVFDNVAFGSLTADNLGGLASDGGPAAPRSITGAAGDDVLTGLAGADTITGLDGADTIHGGIGADVIDGGAGNDRLFGGGGDDVVDGGAGDDYLEDREGGADTLRGGEGNDSFDIGRTAVAPGAMSRAEGGVGDDRFVIKSLNPSAIEIDAGDGADFVEFLSLKGSARLTLGAGQDTIRLDPEYFGPYTNQTRVKTITVTDFAPGVDGDRIDLVAAMNFALASGNGGDLFRTGDLRLIQSGDDTLLEYSYAKTGAPYQTMFRFENTQVADFTDENFGYRVARTLDVSLDGATVTNSASFFGAPAVRITADDANFVNAAGAKLQIGGAYPLDPSVAVVRIEGSGVVVTNERGATIEGGALAVSGSAFGDTLINFGEIVGSVQLGDGADVFTNYGRVQQSVSMGGGDDTFFESASNQNTVYTALVTNDLGAGDDVATFDLAGGNFLKTIDVIGGSGFDRVIIQNFASGAKLELHSTREVERFDLIGPAGQSSVTVSALPRDNYDMFLSPGLSLVVEQASSGNFALTGPAAGHLHLNGGNLTIDVNAAFARVTGSDASETVTLRARSIIPGFTPTGLGVVDLGGGDDKFVWSAHHTSPASVAGGAGDDTLTVSQYATSQSLAAFTGFETVTHAIWTGNRALTYTLTGVDSATQLLLLSSAVEARPSTIHLSGIQAAGLAVGAGAMPLVILADTRIGAVADRAVLDGANAGATAQRIENRGTVLDGMNLAAGDDVLVNSGVIGGRVLLGDGNDSFTGAAGGSVADGVHGGAGNDAYTIEDSATRVFEAAGEGIDEVRTSLSSYVLADHVENLVYTGAAAASLRGNSGDNAISGGAASDLFRLGDGGIDTVTGGAGNDAMIFGAALTADDLVDGGDGADVVAIQGDYAAGLTLGAGNLVNVETLSLLAGSDTRFGASGTNLYSYNLLSVDANVPAGRQLIVNGAALLTGENLTFNGGAETDGSFFIYGGKGVDTLTGGSAADVFFFAEGRLNPGDSFNGGGGNDIVVMRGDFSGPNAAVFTAGTIVNVETVSLLSAADTRFFTGGSTYSYDFTTHDGNVAAGARLTVNAGKLAPGETLTFDGSAELDGFFFLFGGAGADSLTGGAGNDLLYGGLGADLLRGNGGADTFRYQAAGESTLASRDTIEGFAAGIDKIDFSRMDANTANGPGRNAFTFIGSDAFGRVAGQLRVYQDGSRWSSKAMSTATAMPTLSSKSSASTALR